MPKGISNSKKKEGDPIVYWCEHPDFKGMGKEDPGLQDLELVRVWDSLVYEDDCTDELSMALSAEGSFDAAQTRQVLHLVPKCERATAADMNRLQAGALGLHADATDLKPGLQQEDNGPRRPKKEKTAAQTVAAKISVLSAKNAEIMSWSARVSDSDKSSTLKDGFRKELDARRDNLASVRGEFESLYAQRLDDVKDRPDLVAKVETVLRSCEAALTSYNGTLKSIKLAIDTRFATDVLYY
ncbi:unnamed protein product [Durusdinium trenchii]|uniref:Uncharacterized protein n=1 Tax=Durusdinium trenchii TaxID=1381693 RepID=A0ABP0N545_9DINO